MLPVSAKILTLQVKEDFEEKGSPLLIKIGKEYSPVVRGRSLA
jgi:hypothetical protein